MVSHSFLQLDGLEISCNVTNIASLLLHFPIECMFANLCTNMIRNYCDFRTFHTKQHIQRLAHLLFFSFWYVFITLLFLNVCEWHCKTSMNILMHTRTNKKNTYIFKIFGNICVATLFYLRVSICYTIHAEIYILHFRFISAYTPQSPVLYTVLLYVLYYMELFKTLKTL